MRNTKSLKELAKEIRGELKKEYPEYKFSVTTEYYSGGQSLHCSLMAGPDNPFDGDTRYYKDRWTGETYPQGGHAQLNDKYITYDEFEECWHSNGIKLTESAAKMLIEVTKICNRENWDNSDSMTDYFDVNYYFHLNIGKWNRDYQVTA